jgi:hypothetical protein
MREVLRFWHAIPTLNEGHGCYRLVDQRPGGSSGTRNGILEMYHGRDAMGDEQWRTVTPEQMGPCIEALLDQLAVATVTIPTSTEPQATERVEPGTPVINNRIETTTHSSSDGSSYDGVRHVTMFDIEKLTDAVATRLMKRVTGIPR